MPYKKYFSMHVIATLKNYHGNLFVEIGRSSYLRARFPKIDSLPIITMAGVAKFCLQTMMPVLGLSSWSIVSVFRSKLAFIFRLQMIKNNLYKNFWWHKIKLLKCIRQTAKFHLLDNIKQKWPLCYVAVHRFWIDDKFVTYLVKRLHPTNVNVSHTYVTKTIANLTTYSRKPGDYNGSIIFEIDIMKSHSISNSYILLLSKPK